MSGVGTGLNPRAGGAWAGQGREKNQDLAGAGLDCQEGRAGEEPWCERRNLRGVGPAKKSRANKVWARRRTEVGVAYRWQKCDGSDGSL